MAKLRRLTKSLFLLFIICALRQSLTNTLQGKEVQPLRTAKTGEASSQRVSNHAIWMKGKGLGGRKMMMEKMDEMKVSTTSGVERNGSNNSVQRSSNQVNYQDLKAKNMKTAANFGIHNKRDTAHFTTTKAKQISYGSKSSFKSSSMADENKSKGVVVQKIERQRLVDPAEEREENLMVRDYDNNHMARQPPPINNHEPLD